MISLEYAVTKSNPQLLNLQNRILRSVGDNMQKVLDELVKNIKAKFTDTELANTVVSHLERNDFAGGDIYTDIITGTVTSTWSNMVWYEKGRPPGGKMPPIDRIKGYIQKHNIQPDPEISARSFAFAINAARLKKNKHAVPVDVLVEWQNRAGIVVPPDFAVNSLAYAIAKKIQREGIPGKHYFELGLNDTRNYINNSFESVAIATTGIR